MARLILGMLALLGCTAAAPPATLVGSTWRIVSIDGRPPAAGSTPGGRLAAFSFSLRSYGGGVGCNSMGGLYARVADRLYTIPGPQTAMGCAGPVGQQESAVDLLFRGSPRIRQSGGAVWLEGSGHRMELAYLGPAPNREPPTAWQGRGLAGQSFVVHAVDGRSTDGNRIWGKTPPRLTFGARMVTLRLDCPRPATGPFVEDKDTVEATLRPSCMTPGTRDAALVRILATSPVVVSGPNGELLLASRTGWAILWNEHRDRPK